MGALDGGPGADTLSVSGTGITLDADVHPNFEMLAFTAGSNTLSGTHSGLTASSIATGATLDLADGSSLAGDLSNSGTLSLAGSGIGSATISGNLRLNASGTLSLDTLADGSFDQLIVTGVATVDGTLALGQQTTMPDGTVVLIDGRRLIGIFASTTGLINGLLISQEISYDNANGDARLVTSVISVDSAFPSGCIVAPSSPLADGGTLTCISADTIIAPIATSVDGVTIVIGESDTPTSVMTGVGDDAITARIASSSANGSIIINSEFSTLSGGANGIVANTAGSGSITIRGGSVTGNAGDAISATTAGGRIAISDTHTVIGTGGRGISAVSGGGDISIQGVGATGGVSGSAGHGIFANASRATEETGGNINIGDITAIGDVSGSGIGNSGILVQLSSAGATGDVIIDTTAGTVSGAAAGISVVNAGSGTTSITSASVSASAGYAIRTRTTTGASITITAEGTVSGSGGNAAIRTEAPTGDMTSTPSDNLIIMGTVTGGNIETLTGVDTVTLAAGSTTTGITVDLGAGTDTLNLASTAFGALDGGAGADSAQRER